MLEKKSCGGLDGAYALVVGPEQGIFESSNAGYQNTLNQYLELGGERNIYGVKTPGLVVS